MKTFARYDIPSARVMVHKTGAGVRVTVTDRTGPTVGRLVIDVADALLSLPAPEPVREADPDARVVVAGVLTRGKDFDRKCEEFRKAYLRQIEEFHQSYARLAQVPTQVTPWHYQLRRHCDGCTCMDAEG